MVDCVGSGPQSNEQVEQQVTICPVDDLHAIAAAILLAHAKQPLHKVMACQHGPATAVLATSSCHRLLWARSWL